MSRWQARKRLGRQADRPGEEAGVLGLGMVIAVCLQLLIVAIQGSTAQDWIPFRVAAALAPTAQWRDMYPASDATSLFDVSPAYRATAAAQVGDSGVPAFIPESLTGFISPPPAAFLLTALRAVPWRTTMIIWRLSLAIPLCVALVVFSFIGARERRERFRWGLIVLLMAPVLIYVIGSGQPTAWLAVAAITSQLPSNRLMDLVSAAALALAAITKATPLLLPVGFWLIGRRRLGGSALALTLVAVAVSLPFSGVGAWRFFVATAVHMSRTVITDWNNASVDAAIVRYQVAHAGPVFESPAEAALVTIWLLRLLLVTLAIWTVARWRESHEARASALWIAWLAVTPLLWLHYTAVLLPLLGQASKRHVSALVCGALLSGPLILQAAGAGPMLVGNVATVVWVVSAATILRTNWQPALGHSTSAAQAQ